MLPYYRTRSTFITVIATTVLISLIMLRLIISMQRQSQKHMRNINNQLEIRVEQRTEELLGAKEELAKANLELSQLATTDSLTGIANRRYFDQQLLLEWQRCLRENRPLALIFFDIDYFKAYNDNYGHSQGDNCLREITEALANANLTRRPGDVLARYGGEEFIILLSGASEEYAGEIAEKVRLIVDLLAIPHKGSLVRERKHITTSVGYACANKLDNSSPAKLVEQADQALYSAKNSGRNRVRKYSSRASKGVLNLHQVKKLKD
jgi:diguanylate cyclase (GGDEF)-like protein